MALRRPLVLLDDGSTAELPVGDILPGSVSAEDLASPLIARVISDDFITQNTEAGEVGLVGWGFTNGSVVSAAAEANHPGIQLRRSGTTANQIASLYLGAASSTAVIQMGMFDELTWIWRNLHADGVLRLGLFTDVASAAPADGFFVEKLSGDSTYFGLSRAGNVASPRQNTGVAAGPGDWTKARLRRISSGQLEMSLNDGAPLNFFAPPSDTAGLNIGMQIAPPSTTARDALLDFFSMRLRPQVR